MSALTEFKLKLLHDLRASILELKKDQLTLPIFAKCVSDNWSKVTPMGAGLVNPLGNLMRTFEGAEDVEVLDAARDQVIAMIDGSIASLAGEPARPILDDLILKVKDTKLSTLLKEFNAIKDQQPNIAAIGLRTIICLIIQEKAKLTQPEGALAKTQDLMLKPMLRSAIEDKIVSEGETKLLKAFEQQGLKETFDNVVHKPGTGALIRTDDLYRLLIPVCIENRIRVDGATESAKLAQ
jgi:hypothetical protein